MKHVKFFEKGKWADPKDPRAPQFHVEADEVKEVSDSVAEFVISNGKGEEVKAPKEKKSNPAKEDKKAAESK